jgi:hypothetical protein
MNHSLKNASPQLRLQRDMTEQAESIEAPYLKMPVAINSHMPMTLVILYTVVMVAIGVMALANANSQHSHQRTLDQLNAEVDILSDKIDKNGAMILKLFKEKHGVDAFIEQLEQSGVDTTKLVPSEKS